MKMKVLVNKKDNGEVYNIHYSVGNVEVKGDVFVITATGGLILGTYALEHFTFKVTNNE